MKRLPPAVVVLLVALWSSCLAMAQNHPVSAYHEIWVSPDVKSHQGYAFDGTNHYTFDNFTIFKWRNDLKWTPIASNRNVFAGLSGLNHLGDGDCFEGKIYIVGEDWSSCANYTNQSILVFDAKSLTRLEVHNVSAQHHEVSGLAVSPNEGREGVIYVTSYCDGSKIFKYDLRTFDFLGIISLSQSLNGLQGVAWHDGQFFTPEDGGNLYTFGPDGKVSLIYTDKHPGSHEGIKYVGTQLRWLIDLGKGKQCIHFITADP